MAAFLGAVFATLAGAFVVCPLKDVLAVAPDFLAVFFAAVPGVFLAATTAGALLAMTSGFVTTSTTVLSCLLDFCSTPASPINTFLAIFPTVLVVTEAIFSTERRNIAVVAGRSFAALAQ